MYTPPEGESASQVTKASSVPVQTIETTDSCFGDPTVLVPFRLKGETPTVLDQNVVVAAKM